MFNDDNHIEVWATKHLTKIYLLGGLLIPSLLFIKSYIDGSINFTDDYHACIRMIVMEFF